MSSVFDPGSCVLALIVITSGHAEEEDMDWTDNETWDELKSMMKEQRVLKNKHVELESEVTQKQEEVELMRDRYRYLRKQYEDARVRSAYESVELICEGMVREKAAIDVLTKYGVLEMVGRCSM